MLPASLCFRATGNHIVTSFHVDLEDTFLDLTIYPITFYFYLIGVLSQVF